MDQVIFHRCINILCFNHGYWTRVRQTYNSCDSSFCTSCLRHNLVQDTEDRALVLNLSWDKICCRQVFKFESCHLSRFPYTIKGFIKNQMIIFKIKEIAYYLIVNVRGLFRGGEHGDSRPPITIGFHQGIQWSAVKGTIALLQ